MCTHASSAFKFDLTTIPTGSTVLKATLTLYRFYQSGGGNGPTGAAVAKLVRDWDTTANYSRAKTGVNWANPGGDFSTKVSYQLPANSGAPGYDDYVITDQVRSFVESPSTNFGIVISHGGQDSRGYRSHRSTVASQRPSLTIIYEEPVTGTQPRELAPLHASTAGISSSSYLVPANLLGQALDPSRSHAPWRCSVAPSSAHVESTRP